MRGNVEDPLPEDQHRESVDLARKSFSTKFLGTAHTFLRDRINAYRDLLDKHSNVKYLTVLAAVVQSSGMGKSRAVLQLAKHGIFLCYCSFSKMTSSGFPRRTEGLADILENSESDVDFVYYFKAWFISLASFLKSTLGEKMGKDQEAALQEAAVAWKEKQLTDNSPLHAEILSLLKAFEAEKEREADLSKKPAEQDNRNEELLKKELAEVEGLLSGFDGVRLVFVFDEAGSLINTKSGAAFYVARRALRVFFKWKKTFSLMLDTAAKLSNLLPRQLDDPSIRAAFEGYQLLPPIYYLPNFKIGGVLAKHFPEPEVWLKYGRPLWAASLEKQEDAGEVIRLRDNDQLVRLAMAKLVVVLEGVFQNQEVDVFEGKMTVTQGLALLAAATGLDICPKSIIAETMAASHMNVIVYVSKDRRTVFVTQPYEPILAEAAGRLLGHHAKVLTAALKHMLSSCLSGYVTGGPRGEFVAKFLLMAAVWACKKNVFVLDEIPLDEYLDKLLCKNMNDEALGQLEGLKKKVKGCKIRFNTYVILTHPPTKADLERALAAGCAIMYMADNNLPGADIIVPFWKANGEVGAMVISVKNWKKSYSFKKESTTKLESKYTRVGVVGHDVITILMSMREPSVKTPIAWKIWSAKDSLASQLTIYGIANNYDFLDKDARELLQLILITVPDPMAHAETDEEIEWIKELQNNILELDEEVDNPGVASSSSSGVNSVFDFDNSRSLWCTLRSGRVIRNVYKRVGVKPYQIGKELKFKRV